MQNISLAAVMTNTDNLLWGLKAEKYDAILSSMPPYPFKMPQYDFSDLYLETGPVLVVSISSNIMGFDQLDGKEIGVQTDNTSYAQLLEKAPGVLIRNFDSIPQGLTDIMAENLDGVIIDFLSATAYIEDLYQGQLKIVTPPLTNEGLRLVTLHDHAPELISAFNKGLKNFQEKGRLTELSKKWGLPLYSK